MSKLLNVTLACGGPTYEDDRVIAYRIPNSTSNTPFLIMGENWNPPQQFNNTWVRWMTNNSTLFLVNNSNQTQYASLQFTVETDGPTKHMYLYVNDELTRIISTEAYPKTVGLDRVELKSGITVVRFLVQEGTESTGHPIDAYSANEGPEMISVAFTQILFRPEDPFSAKIQNTNSDQDQMAILQSVREENGLLVKGDFTTHNSSRLVETAWQTQILCLTNQPATFSAFVCMKTRVLRTLKAHKTVAAARFNYT
jgi:hypothetical protein